MRIDIVRMHNAHQKCLREHADFVVKGNLEYDLQGDAAVEIC